MQWPIIPIKNLTSLFPLIFLSKHISLHALGRLKWVLDIIWPLNQHFNLKNQRNWIKQVLMLSFLIGIICILLHWQKKLTLTLSRTVLTQMLPLIQSHCRDYYICCWQHRVPCLIALHKIFPTDNESMNITLLSNKTTTNHQ